MYNFQCAFHMPLLHMQSNTEIPKHYHFRYGSIKASVQFFLSKIKVISGEHCLCLFPWLISSSDFRMFVDSFVGPPVCLIVIK